MKRLVCLFLALALLLSMSVCVLAEKSKLLIIDESDNTVAEYDIEVNSTSEDLRPVVQKAFDYIKNDLNDGKIYTVRLPQGKYGVYSSMDIYSNTVFDLNGSTLYRMTDNCGSIIRFGRGEEIVYGFDGYKNITIKNGIIDSARNGDTSLVRFAHATNTSVLNVTFKNTMSVHHLLTFAACDGVLVKGCSFLDMDVSKLDDSYNCEAIQIDILKQSHFSYPAHDGTPTKNVEITECLFKNVPRGSGTHAGVAGHYFDNVNMTNNIFENVDGYAIKAINYRNSDFTGNIIKNCGSGITIGNNTFTNSGNYYAPFNKTDKIYQKCYNNISNNKISLKDTSYSNVAFAIQVFGFKASSLKDAEGNKYSGDFRTSAVKIENNEINSIIAKNNFYAIWLNGAFGSSASSSSDFCIKNNKINFNSKTKSNNNYYGIKLENSKNIYVGSNSVTDTKSSQYNLHSGFVSENCSGLLITLNKFSGMYSFGMKLTTVSSSEVSSNTVKNVLSNGIYIYTGCKDISVKNNSVFSPKGYGIAVLDSTVKSLDNNKVLSAKSSGIYISGKAYATAVNSNYIFNPKGNGIYLNKKAGAKYICKNLIDVSGATYNGIYINNTAKAYMINNNQINCKANKNSKTLKVKCKNGIMINSKNSNTVQILSNKIKYCATNGISIYACKAKAKISKNNVYSCYYGIYYCKGSLSKNTVKKCKKAKTKKI